MKQSLKIPSHLKRVATLHCESKCQETTFSKTVHLRDKVTIEH